MTKEMARSPSSLPDALLTHARRAHFDNRSGKSRRSTARVVSCRTKREHRAAKSWSNPHHGRCGCSRRED